MNGLSYIRMRCNMSLNELADILGVSRQAVSSWELGKKEIPEKRKKQLSVYFGIDAKYFEEISEEEKEQITEKAMFRYIENGRERYLYRLKDGVELKDTTLCFSGALEMSLDEQYIAVQKRKQDVIKKVDEIIRYYDKGGSLLSQIGNINRGCNLYENINALMDEMPKQAIVKRMAYYQEILFVVQALMVAHGLLTKTEIQQYYGDIADRAALYDGTDWILRLADMLSEHWSGRAAELDAIDKQSKEQKKKLNENAEERKVDFDELIENAEIENKRLWNEAPDAKKYGGVHISGKYIQKIIGGKSKKDK